MPIYLRQSTASQELLAFPFIDATDGFTEEAGLTINNTDIKLAKTGVLTLASKNSGGATYVSNSAYSMTLDATDTDTIGPMQIFIHVAGARPVRLECCVLDEAVYDVMFGTNAPLVAGVNAATTSFSNGFNITGGTNGDALVLLATTSGHGLKSTGVGSAKHGALLTGGTNASGASLIGAGTGHGLLLTAGGTGAGLSVDIITVSGATTFTGAVTASNASNNIMGIDVAKISGDAAAADNLESEYDGTGWAGVLQRTTIATLASQTSFTLTAGSADNDAYNDCVIVIQDASTAAQKAVGRISDYVGSTKTVTLSASPGIFTMAATDIVTILAPGTSPTAIADSLLDRADAIETGLTPREALRLMSAAMCGVLTGAGGTQVTILGADVTTTRIVATVDDDGNRLAMSLTP